MSFIPVSQLPRGEQAIREWGHIFPLTRGYRSICQAGLSIFCQRRLKLPVSNGSLSWDVLGSDTLTFIFSQAAFFPKSRRSWSGLRSGSSCKGEQRVLRAQGQWAQPVPSPTPLHPTHKLASPHHPYLLPWLLASPSPSVFQEV